MASIVLKHGKWYARVKGYKRAGRWSLIATQYPEAQREAAQAFADEAQAAINKRGAPVDIMTLERWFETWIQKREAEEVDWKKDRGRLRTHVLPVLGQRELTSITTGEIAQLVHALRFDKRLAPRTVRNVYSALSAMMRDAAIEGLIASSPCLLTKKQLGSVVDKDPEWRSGAVYTRDEAETLISDPRIPLDRQVTYGLGLLGGLRPGEGAALRWRHYEPGELGRLIVARSYSTSYSKTKRTKTETTKTIPVHPTLAAMLEAWRAGWAAMFGHEPGPEDLIIPLPPDVRRRTRTGDRYRGWDYSGRMWRDVDLPALGWRHRQHYNMRATFITLAIEDGASPDVIRERVTHTKARRTAFDGYDRGPHWVETCRELAKLRLVRRVTVLSPFDTVCTQPNDREMLDGADRSGGGFRMPGGGTLSHGLSAPTGQDQPPLRSSCDEGFALWSHDRVTAEEDEEP